MKNLFFVFCVALSPIVTRAEQVEGKWKILNEEGKLNVVVEVYVDEDKLYGKIVDLPQSVLPEEERCDFCPNEYNNQFLLDMEVLRGLDRDGHEWEKKDGLFSVFEKAIFGVKVWYQEPVLKLRVSNGEQVKLVHWERYEEDEEEE